MRYQMIDVALKQVPYNPNEKSYTQSGGGFIASSAMPAMPPPGKCPEGMLFELSEALKTAAQAMKDAYNRHKFRGCSR
jgi:hypothetical protein